jgi:hypothetical protein
MPNISNHPNEDISTIFKIAAVSGHRLGRGFLSTGDVASRSDVGIVTALVIVASAKARPVRRD